MYLYRLLENIFPFYHHHFFSLFHSEWDKIQIQ
jgi:hypothetical protein